ncbi:MAG: UrcA family protein [Sphingomonadales bacterium]|nr:UrcA family protein [Sphingomonadales bacterium]MBD3773647.1 UrcA family protein [Paracoccaceae bacterium]
MMRPLLTRSLAAAAMIGSIALAGPAYAETMSIQYKDLNLATAKGQKILEARIDQAAREVCGANDLRTGTRVRSAAERACVADAKAKAKEQFAALIEDKQLGG